VRKSLRILLIILVVLILVAVIPMIISRRASNTPYYTADMPKPLVIAHQGGDGVWPGNTMVAFQKAAALGVDAIETDLRQTKDGVLVISHDESVERISNGAGRIVDLTYADLQKLDAGYNWSPDGGKTFPYRGQGITYTSLEEVYKALPNMRFNIDMKQTEPPIEAAFCNLTRQYGMQDKVVAASFNHKNNVAFRKLCPEVTTSADETETRNFVFLNFAFLGRWYSPQFKVFQVPVEQSGIPIITRHFVNAAHERNLRVDVWTIDDPAEMKRLIDLNVDGIMSDRPDLLMQVVGR
jgi:glycerophosphoryl diester phosphodiesterase